VRLFHSLHELPYSASDRGSNAQSSLEVYNDYDMKISNVVSRSQELAQHESDNDGANCEE
jgi:hypothetical protein